MNRNAPLAARIRLAPRRKCGYNAIQPGAAKRAFVLLNKFSTSMSFTRHFANRPVCPESLYVCALDHERKPPSLREGTSQPIPLHKHTPFQSGLALWKKRIAPHNRANFHNLIEPYPPLLPFKKPLDRCARRCHSRVHLRGNSNSGSRSTPTRTKNDLACGVSERAVTP